MGAPPPDVHRPSIEGRIKDRNRGAQDQPDARITTAMPEKKKSSNRRLAGRIVPVAISSSLSKSNLNASFVAPTMRLFLYRIAGDPTRALNTYGTVGCE